MGIDICVVYVVVVVWCIRVDCSVGVVFVVNVIVYGGNFVVVCV